jgi:hypothetical protein
MAPAAEAQALAQFLKRLDHDALVWLPCDKRLKMLATIRGEGLCLLPPS